MILIYLCIYLHCTPNQLRIENQSCNIEAAYIQDLDHLCHQVDRYKPRYDWARSNQLRAHKRSKGNKDRRIYDRNMHPIDCSRYDNCTPGEYTLSINAKSAIKRSVRIKWKIYNIF